MECLCTVGKMFITDVCSTKVRMLAKVTVLEGRQR